jgi:hypothetical protein
MARLLEEHAAPLSAEELRLLNAAAHCLERVACAHAVDMEDGALSAYYATTRDELRGVSTDAAGHRRRAAAWAYLRRLLRHQLPRAREDGEVWLAALLTAHADRGRAEAKATATTQKGRKPAEAELGSRAWIRRPPRRHGGMGATTGVTTAGMVEGTEGGASRGAGEADVLLYELVDWRGAGDGTGPGEAASSFLRVLERLVMHLLHDGGGWEEEHAALVTLSEGLTWLTAPRAQAALMVRACCGPHNCVNIPSRHVCVCVCMCVRESTSRMLPTKALKKPEELPMTSMGSGASMDRRVSSGLVRRHPHRFPPPCGCRRESWCCDRSAFRCRCGSRATTRSPMGSWLLEAAVRRHSYCTDC